ncbi:MAG: DUF3300 domain-containing protein [Nitrospinae bacterium]|nr:DUF3300 domain-containing protein [Nitrospinota bacterium]
MLAPIALYPDALLSQILMAATYPIEVVNADRWLQNPNNASLHGDALDHALQEQPWDPSVKSLVPFPQILRMMDDHLTWTENLGNAFLANQASVMDSVQRLRWNAKNAGTLASTPQQRVVVDGQIIVLEPADPQIVYVPYYNPAVVYPGWAYPAYPPYFFPWFGFEVGFGFGFGIGYPVLWPYWGWHHCNWRHHRFDLDRDRFNRINFGRPPITFEDWRHDPWHRHGVRYRDPEVRARFRGGEVRPRQGNFRGYVEPPPTHNVRPQRIPSSEPHRAPAPQTFRPPAPQTSRPRAPAFESYGHGAEVRVHERRGIQSLKSAGKAEGRADTVGRGGFGGGKTR